MPAVALQGTPSFGEEYCLQITQDDIETLEEVLCQPQPATPESKSTGPLTPPKVHESHPIKDGDNHHPQLVNGESLRPWDIICGRCSTAFNNIGNRRFRVTISLNVVRYIDAPTRADKKLVITSIVDVLVNDAGARFLKRAKGGGFIEISKKEVRNKVQQ